jgi:cytochrome b pre-mRNA-processing protein 3
MPARRSVWSLLPSRRGRDPTATELYGRVVAQARAEPFYASLGVPDTPEGRLELIMMHLVLVQERLKALGEPGTVLARDLSETFVADLDDCLREMAVSDIAVPRKVKKVAAALFDRTRDYGAALAGGDVVGLARLIEQHVLMVPAGGSAVAVTANAGTIAGYALAAHRRLGTIDLATLAGGALPWPDTWPDQST